MSITLTITQGPHKGRSWPFDGHDTFLVGRDPSAHFCVPNDPYFSRMHMLLEVNPPLCRLTDLGTRNGTKVNGKKVLSTVLQNGDEVKAGETIFVVSMSGATSAQTLDLPPEPSLTHFTTDLPPLDEAGTGTRVADLDNIMADLQRRRARGEAPSASEYHSRFPHLEGALKQAIPSKTDSISMPSGEQFPPISGYLVLAELGRGGMGIVYRCYREDDGQIVAVKTIRPNVAPNSTAVTRFLREAMILRQLSHPNIVRFTDMGEAGELLWFAMDYVEGTDAAKLVKSEGPRPIVEAVNITIQMLEALGYAHQKGFVHRDIKPANLLIARLADSSPQVRVADFGLARTWQTSQLSGLTITGSAAGTPQFMPPEQVTDFRTVKPPADQYSASATLYYLLTGQHVFTATNTTELFRKILLEDPKPVESLRPEIPSGLAKVIHRALLRRAEDRYPDVGAMIKALTPFA